MIQLTEKSPAESWKPWTIFLGFIEELHKGDPMQLIKNLKETHGSTFLGGNSADTLQYEIQELCQKFFREFF